MAPRRLAAFLARQRTLLPGRATFPAAGPAGACMRYPLRYPLVGAAIIVTAARRPLRRARRARGALACFLIRVLGIKYNLNA